jgi:hypothetical protein
LGVVIQFSFHSMRSTDSVHNQKVAETSLPYCHGGQGFANVTTLLHCDNIGQSKMAI